jgi:2-aminoadipate transaminase
MTRVELDKWQKVYAERVSSIRPSAVRTLFAAASRPDIISFAGGMPHPKSFPLEAINKLSKKVLVEQGEKAFQYGSSEGLWELRVEISKLMAGEGIKIHPEEVLITDGAQQALDLLGKIFVDPGSVVITEAPSYVGALNAFLSYQADVEGVPMDQEGMMVEELPGLLKQLKKKGRKPRFLYAIPNFQNPAGVTLSEERREFLVNWARDEEILLVEDNPYGSLRFEGERLAHLRALNDDIIYLGTFSKVFSPGVRIGWVVAPHSILEKMVRGKEAVNLCPSPLTQHLLVAYLRENDLSKHIEFLIELYTERRNAMLEALEEYFPEEVTWTHPAGGLFIWVTLPPYVNATEMLAQALERKVAYVPGEAFFADKVNLNTLRLNFSYSEPELIFEGIKRLGKVVKDFMALTQAFIKKPAPKLKERKKKR